MKITVIGGGSTYTPELIDGLLKIKSAIGLEEIALVDIPSGHEKLAILADFSRRLVSEAGSDLKITETEDLAEGVDGASAVINQFRAGGLESRARDERIPLDYGLIGQETTGVGGMANALRSLPILDTIVDEVERRANGAWIVNFTNPAGLNTEYLLNTRGYEHSIGLCNVPINFILEAASLFECSRNEIYLNYYGLNHLSWVEGVKVNGRDRTSEMWDAFRVKMKNNPEINYAENFFPELKLLLNPYMDYFYNTRKMLKKELADRDGEGTRAEQILRIESELLGLYAESDRQTIPEQLSKRGGFMYSTVAAELLRDIFTDAGTIHIVNTRNRGALSDFPDDYVMEIPTKIGVTGPEPLLQGVGNPVAIGLIHTIKQYERLTIMTHSLGEERYARQALLIHPLGPDEADLDDLWGDLKKANTPWWKTSK